MLIVGTWKSTSSNSREYFLCKGTWVQVLCMAFMSYLIDYYFNNMLDHDE